MANYISKINVGGTEYEIKDAAARQSITGTLHFKGVTTTPITNGGTQVPTDIYGTNATTSSIALGDFVIYSKGEYIWAPGAGKGTATTTYCWTLLDYQNAYGSLASKNSASGTTASNGEHTHTIAANTVLTGVTGASTTASATYTPAGSVSSNLSNATAAAQAITLNGGSTGKLQTATYTPTSSTIQVIESVGSVPSLTTEDASVVTGVSNANKCTASVTNEILTISFSDATVTKGTVKQVSKWAAGSTPTKKSQSVITAAGSITYATGKTTADGTTFGTGVAIALHSGATAKASNVSGTVSSTFKGTQATISTTFTPLLTPTKNTAVITTSSNGAHTHTVTVS